MRKLIILALMITISAGLFTNLTLGEDYSTYDTVS